MVRQQRSLWLVVALAAAMSTNLFADDQVRRDGNWWRTIDASAKYAYMVGFFDGLAGDAFDFLINLGNAVLQVALLAEQRCHCIGFECFDLRL